MFSSSLDEDDSECSSEHENFQKALEEPLDITSNDEGLFSKRIRRYLKNFNNTQRNDNVLKEWVSVAKTSSKLRRRLITELCTLPSHNVLCDVFSMLIVEQVLDLEECFSSCTSPHIKNNLFHFISEVAPLVPLKTFLNFLHVNTLGSVFGTGNDETRMFLCDTILKLSELKYGLKNCDRSLRQHVVDNFKNVYMLVIEELRKSENRIWYKLCMFTLNYFGKLICQELELFNCLLSNIEQGFKSKTVEDKLYAFDCWKVLIDVASEDHNYLCSSKTMNLLLKPLSIKLSRNEQVTCKRLEVWIHLLSALQEHCLDCLEGFMKFCFDLHTPLIKSTLSQRIQVLTNLIGHYERGECCLCGKDCNTEISSIPNVITSMNFVKYKNLVLDAVKYCCDNISTCETKSFRQKIMKCLWGSLFRTIGELPILDKELMLRNVFLILNDVLKKCEEDRYKNADDILEPIFTILCELTDKNGNNLYIEIIVFPLVQLMLNSPDVPEYMAILIVHLLWRCPKVDGRLEYFNKCCDLLKSSNIYHTTAAYLWYNLINELQQIVSSQGVTKDLRAVCEYLMCWICKCCLPDKLKVTFTDKWISVMTELNVISNGLKDMILEHLKKCLKSNPTSAFNFIDLVVFLINQVKKDDSMTYVNNLLSVMLECLKNPYLKNEKIVLGLPIILKVFSIFSEQDLTKHENTIFKLLECAEYFLKPHQVFDVLETLKLIVPQLPPNLKQKFPSNLRAILNDLLTHSDTTVAQRAISLVAELDRKATQIPKTKPHTPIAYTPRPMKVIENTNKSLNLFAQTLQNSPITVKGSAINISSNSKSKVGKVANAMPNFNKKSNINIDEKSSDFVYIDTEVKPDYGKMLPHQKEMLRRRREDIPALYQDLSQSQHSESMSLDGSNKGKIDNKLAEDAKNVSTPKFSTTIQTSIENNSQDSGEIKVLSNVLIHKIFKSPQKDKSKTDDNAMGCEETKKNDDSTDKQNIRDADNSFPETKINSNSRSREKRKPRMNTRNVRSNLKRTSKTNEEQDNQPNTKESPPRDENKQSPPKNSNTELNTINVNNNNEINVKTDLINLQDENKELNHQEVNGKSEDVFQSNEFVESESKSSDFVEETPRKSFMNSKRISQEMSRLRMDIVGAEDFFRVSSKRRSSFTVANTLNSNQKKPKKEKSENTNASSDINEKIESKTSKSNSSNMDFSTKRDTNSSKAPHVTGSPLMKKVNSKHNLAHKEDEGKAKSDIDTNNQANSSKSRPVRERSPSKKCFSKLSLDVDKGNESGAGKRNSPKLTPIRGRPPSNRISSKLCLDIKDEGESGARKSKASNLEVSSKNQTSSSKLISVEESTLLMKMPSTLCLDVSEGDDSGAEKIKSLDLETSTKRPTCSPKLTIVVTDLGSKNSTSNVCSDVNEGDESNSLELETKTKIQTNSSKLTPVRGHSPSKKSTSKLQILKISSKNQTSVSELTPDKGSTSLKKIPSKLCLDVSEGDESEAEKIKSLDSEGGTKSSTCSPKLTIVLKDPSSKKNTSNVCLDGNEGDESNSSESEIRTKIQTNSSKLTPVMGNSPSKKRISKLHILKISSKNETNFSELTPDKGGTPLKKVSSKLCLDVSEGDESEAEKIKCLDSEVGTKSSSKITCIVKALIVNTNTSNTCLDINEGDESNSSELENSTKNQTNPSILTTVKQSKPSKKTTSKLCIDVNEGIDSNEEKSNSSDLEIVFKNRSNSPLKKSTSPSPVSNLPLKNRTNLILSSIQTEDVDNTSVTDGDEDIIESSQPSNNHSLVANVINKTNMILSSDEIKQIVGVDENTIISTSPRKEDVVVDENGSKVNSNVTPNETSKLSSPESKEIIDDTLTCNSAVSIDTNDQISPKASFDKSSFSRLDLDNLPTGLDSIDQEKNLPGSPVSEETPRRNTQLLDLTLDISPIRTDHESQIIEALDLKTFQNESTKESIENAKVSFVEMTSTPTTHLKVPTSRSMVLLKLVPGNNVKMQKAEKSEKSVIKYTPNVTSSPSTNRIRKMMLECNKNAMKANEAGMTESTKQFDVLEYKKDVPSPFATPNRSILKRKAYEVLDSDGSPCPKRKRVNFSDPPVTDQKIYFKEQEENCSGDSSQTAMIKKKRSQPVYPLLINCAEDIRSMFGCFKQDVVYDDFVKHDILTVGDLAKSTWHKVNRLTFINNPKLHNVAKALSDFAANILENSETIIINPVEVEKPEIIETIEIDCALSELKDSDEGIYELWKDLKAICTREQLCLIHKDLTEMFPDK